MVASNPTEGMNCSARPDFSSRAPFLGFALSVACKATTRLVTLVFVTGLGGRGEAPPSSSWWCPMESCLLMFDLTDVLRMFFQPI